MYASTLYHDAPPILTSLNERNVISSAQNNFYSHEATDRFSCCCRCLHFCLRIPFCLCAPQIFKNKITNVFVMTCFICIFQQPHRTEHKNTIEQCVHFALFLLLLLLEKKKQEKKINTKYYNTIELLCEYFILQLHKDLCDMRPKLYLSKQFKFKSKRCTHTQSVVYARKRRLHFL